MQAVPAGRPARWEWVRGKEQLEAALGWETCGHIHGLAGGTAAGHPYEDGGGLRGDRNFALECLEESRARSQSLPFWGVQRWVNGT